MDHQATPAHTVTQVNAGTADGQTEAGWGGVAWAEIQDLPSDLSPRGTGAHSP